MMKSVFLLGIMMSLLVFTPFAFGQDLQKATWLENASVVYDQIVSKSVIASITFQTSSNTEIQFSDQHRTYKVRKNDWEFEVNLLAGDTNLDNVIDIIDINYVIDYYDQPDPTLDMYHLYRYDKNKDGEINIGDIEILVDQILY